MTNDLYYNAMNLIDQRYADAITKSLWFQRRELHLTTEILKQAILDEMPRWLRWMFMRIS